MWALGHIWAPVRPVLRGQVPRNCYWKHYRTFISRKSIPLAQMLVVDSEALGVHQRSGMSPNRTLTSFKSSDSLPGMSG